MNNYNIKLEVEFEGTQRAFSTDIVARDKTGAEELAIDKFLSTYLVEVTAQLCPREEYDHEYIATINVEFEDQIQQYKTCIVATGFSDAETLAKDKFLATVSVSVG